jgi:hypothetical protein
MYLDDTKCPLKNTILSTESVTNLVCLFAVINTNHHAGGIWEAKVILILWHL